MYKMEETNMTIVKHENNVARIYNEEGIQAIGTDDANLAGLNPRELIEAAVALCTTITTRKVLERDGIEFDVNDIQATVVASKAEGVKNRFTDFDVQVKLPKGLDEAYIKKLLVTVERGCTVSNTVKSQANVELVVVD